MSSTTLPQSEIDILLEFFPQGVVAVDLETTGLSPLIDRIIEISAIKITPATIKTFDHLVDPEIPIPEYTIAIHGINDSDVAGKPLIEKILPHFLEFTDDLPIIAHNAKFDIGFIVFALHKKEIDLNHSEVFDSCKMARNCIKGPTAYKLGVLADYLNIDLVNHHRALDDAIACLRVYAHSLLECRKNSVSPISKRKGSRLFNVSDFSKNVDLKIPHRLKLLEQRVVEQLKMEIMYNGGSHKGKFRPIRPIALLPLPYGNILYAHCLLSDVYKSFALKKISQARDINR